MPEPRVVPFEEVSLGGTGGAGSSLTWKLQAGEVGMWAKKPLQQHKTIHIFGASVVDVAIEGTNFDDKSHPVTLKEHKTGEKIEGEGLFVLHENSLFFRPVCREGVDVEVVAVVTL